MSPTTEDELQHHATFQFRTRHRRATGARLVVGTVACALGSLVFLQRCVEAQDSQARQLTVTVRDVTGLAGRRPVTGGVPLAHRAAPEGSRFVLADERGNRVPCQTSVMARWNLSCIDLGLKPKKKSHKLSMSSGKMARRFNTEPSLRTSVAL